MNPFESLPNVGVTRVRATAEACGVAPATIYKWVKAGLLPKPIRIGPNASAFPNQALKEFGARRSKEVA